MTKGILMVVAAAAMAGALSGCAYAGVGVAADKAVVARNDGFLWGLLRKVYVCKVTDAGLTGCNSSDSP